MVVSNRNLQTSRGPPFSGANRSFGGEKDLHERTYYGSWLVRGNFFRDKWNECRPWKTRNYVNKRIIYIYISSFSKHDLVVSNHQRVMLKRDISSFSKHELVVSNHQRIMLKRDISSFSKHELVVSNHQRIMLKRDISSFSKHELVVSNHQRIMLKREWIIFQAWIGSFQGGISPTLSGVEYWISRWWFQAWTFQGIS